MKSYIVKLIQTYMDIISLNEDMSNNFDESIRQKQDELNQNNDQTNDESDTDNDSDDILNNDYQNHLGMQSELDKIHKGQTFSKEELLQTNTPIIYAFITKYAPNAIKIGYTVQGAEQRVKQWQKYYSDAKLIGWWTATQLDNAMHKVFFMDFNVHARTRSYGYSNLKDPANKFDFDEFKRLAKEDGIENIHVSSEFFMKYKDMKIKDTSSELNEKIITDIITEIKNDIKEGKNVGKLYDLETHQETTHHEYGAADTYENTPLQQDAINKAIDAMKRGCTDLLLSAVMRFGKTHCCYEIIKEAPDIKYVLVTSAKADVRAAWKDDINHEDFLDNFVFIELPSDGSLTISKKNQKGVYEEVKKENPNKIKQYIDEGKTVIVFATLQDLAGKKGFDANVIKDKHKFLYNDEYPLDMIIIDETHYGSHSNVYGTAVGLAKNKYEANSTELKEAKKEAEDVDRISKAVDEIKHKYTLQCSGTPYYILASGEFSEIYKNKEIISNVGFSDMIDARDKWVDEHINDDNFDESKSPYFGIPNMIKFGMNLTKECRKVLSKNKDINTSLSFLFKNSNDKFENESAVTELMESIFGENNHKMPGFLDQKRIKEGEIFKHIIMVLPHIDDCHVLKKLLIDKNIIDDDPESDEYRKIIVATERRTAKDKDARKLDPEATDSTSLNQALWSLENKGKRSLTITVNRFLTGVSVPLWDAMFYMKDTASPQEYDQAIFRLCTRNVGNATYTDENGVEQKQKICRKANVYLIDFKVDRMYNMMVNSAVSQCGADKAKKHNIEEVKELINKSIEQVPTYVDSVYDTNGKHILNGIHEITADDLLKQYVKYNRERSIEDSIDLKQFNSFLDNLDNMKYIQRWSEGLLNQTKLEQKEGSDELPVDDKGFDSAVDKAQEKSGNISKADKKDKAELETMKKKFTTMLKSVLYSCICMNNIPEDIMNYIELVCSDSECEQIAKDFKIDVDELSDIISRMNDAEIMQINMLIYQLKCLLDDKNIPAIQRVQNAISKLGKLDKSEVITPVSLTSKMVKKLSREDVQNAESILLVNEKVCEFFIQLYNDYGIEVCKKCKIVPSSELTINFIRKILKTLQLSESIIMKINDIDGNGFYDVKDFLDMKNEDIIKMNQGKKFDVILSNPPYNLANKMLAKYFEIGSEICTVQPSTWLLGKQQKKDIVKHVDTWDYSDIESINGNEFFDANIGGVMAIQLFKENNPINHNRRYIIYDGKEYNKCSEISSTSNDSLLQNFKNIIISICNKDNLEKHMRAIPDDPHLKKYWYNNQNVDEYCIKVDLIRGHENKKTGQHKDDFYTIISNNEKTILSSIGNFKDLIKKKNNLNKRLINFYIPSINLNITNNIINYLKTDFCRAGLLFQKINTNMYPNVFIYIPWFDFSNNIFSKTPSEIDDYLFTKYNISNETRKHIEELLPDYYNIRKGRD